MTIIINHNELTALAKLEGVSEKVMTFAGALTKKVEEKSSFNKMRMFVCGLVGNTTIQENNKMVVKTNYHKDLIIEINPELIEDLMGTYGEYLKAIANPLQSMALAVIQLFNTSVEFNKSDTVKNFETKWSTK